MMDDGCPGRLPSTLMFLPNAEAEQTRSIKIWHFLSVMRSRCMIIRILTRPEIRLLIEDFVRHSAY